MILTNSFFATLTVLVRSSFLFILGILLARYLSVEDLGTYRSLLAIVAVCCVIAKLGLDETLLRFGGECVSKKNIELFNRLFLVSTIVRIISTSIVILICYLFWNEIFGFFKLKVTHSIFYTFSFFVFSFSFYTTIGTSLFSARKKNIIPDIIDIIKEVFLFSFIYIGLHYYCYSYKEILFTRSLFILVCIVLLLFIHLHWYKSNKSMSSHFLGFKRVFRYTSFSYLTTLLFGVPILQLQLLLISFHDGPSSVGIYSIVTFLPLVLSTINPGSMLRKVIEPLMIEKYYASESRSDFVLQEGFSVLLRMSLFITLPFFAFSFFHGDFILLKVFSSNYMNYSDVLICFSIGQIFNLSVSSFAPIFSIIEKKELSTLSSILIPFNLLISYYLMIVYGLFGVALAYTIYSLILFSYYLFTIKIVLKVNLSLPISSILKIIFNILPILFLGFICTSLSDNIYVRMITIILSLIIYIVISFYNSPLNNNETYLLKNYLKSKFSWIS